MKNLHQELLRSDFDILHLRPKNPEKLVGGFDDLEKFKVQTEAFVRYCF